MEKSLRKHLDQRVTELNNEFNGSWYSHYKDLCDYVAPRSGRFSTSDRNQGDKRNSKILNEAATFAIETLQRGMMYGVTNPSRPWLRVKTPSTELNKAQEVRQWLDSVSTRILEVFLRSHLYTVLPNIYEELGTYGTAAVGINKDADSIVRFEHFPVGSYRLASSGSGRVDTLVREFQMTRRAIVDRWGKENCSDELRTAVENDEASLDGWVDIVHVLEPNPDYVAGSPWNDRLKFRSVYYEKAAKEEKFLEKTGMSTFRVLAPRWKVRGLDVYGESPLMQVLGTVKGLQKLENKSLMLLSKVVDPPLIVPTSLKQKAINQLPGSVNFADAMGGQQAITPMFQISNAPLEAAEAKIGNYIQRINKCLFTDIFLMMAGDQRSNITAEEIRARLEEKVQTIGPILVRLNDELLDPLIETTFEIMADPDFVGLIPAPPERMAGAPLNIEYVSDLARAMKLAGISSIESTVNYVMGIAKFQAEIGTDPTALDKLNFDEAIDNYSDLMGAPAAIINDLEHVSPIREQRAQAQAQQAQMEQLQMAAKTVKDLGTTPTGGDSVLANLGGAA